MPGDREMPLVRADALNRQGDEGKAITIPEDTEGQEFRFTVYSRGIKIYETETFPISNAVADPAIPVTIYSAYNSKSRNDLVLQSPLGHLN